MTKYVFTVGAKNMTGNLNWNANGTLNNLAIVDGFNSGGTQTCNFNSMLPGGKGYDDWGRLLGVDCGSGQWGQTYSYDNYDNLSKSASISGRIGTNWNPVYNPSNNHCSGCTYDANGDVTGDGNNVYGWNEFAKVAWTATSGTPTCGSSGRCAVYDAFGRMVEQTIGSTFRERWITQLGETAYMTGTSPIYAYWPAPMGGKVLLYGNSTNYDYLHADWLGNARIDSSLTSNTVTTDQAYSPYGELYDIFGSDVGQNEGFAGMTGNFAPGTTTPVMWDTPNRELSMVGRWLSPDPASAGWNQYAYSTNPNSQVDPSGLHPVASYPWYWPENPGGMDWASVGLSGGLFVNGQNGGGSPGGGTVAADQDLEQAISFAIELAVEEDEEAQDAAPLDPFNLLASAFGSASDLSDIMAGAGNSPVFLQGCGGPQIPCVAVLDTLQPPATINYADDGSMISAEQPYNWTIEDNAGAPIQFAHATEWILALSDGGTEYEPLFETAAPNGSGTDHLGFGPGSPPNDAFMSAQAVSVQIGGEGPIYLLNQTNLIGASMGNGIFTSFSKPFYGTQYPFTP
jgi:RHS repeat-associated protein